MCGNNNIQIIITQRAWGIWKKRERGGKKVPKNGKTEKRKTELL